MQREVYLQEIKDLFEIFPIVALLGPRQVGKTTLARLFRESCTEEVHSFDLEDPEDLSLLENPKQTFNNLKGLIIIDEIQTKPDLFPLLRVLADHNKHFQKYLILGSTSPSLIRKSSETLTGRVGFIEVTPFAYSEVHGDINELWTKGGFPNSYLKNDNTSWRWRKDYVRTFLDRDLPALGINIQPTSLRKFWSILSNYHGGIFNASEMGNIFGASHHTMKSYLQILEGTFMIRQLAPWHENITKRQIKSPKIYFRDSGLLHYLLSIKTFTELILHPKIGDLFEGFALEEVIKLHQNTHQSGDFYYWTTVSRAELDLLLIDGQKRTGFEFKYTDKPIITKSMRIAMEDLKLDFLNIITPGQYDVMLESNVRAVGLEKYLKAI
jgi:predicted AAA+ superfamily ATPase